ncbi:hypothetical protein DesLBE_5320 [Desulfitobacterium sp. LBE]|uniref:Uncharacterized protein n=1 Tax=Desulfitobacterium hafniense (strain Y51) TaxID=138119 RepID=Q24VK0_DESHY|nr:MULTISPECIES: hypothetical protein [Desulfitobacterium]TWH60866.1 hypothetical protein DesLBE_5320 [Desulfitobacterium sp. LBE]BAE83942.1 hypothetical protein DSY2153 [Desulfitobacterium hafniense Y51]
MKKLICMLLVMFMTAFTGASVNAAETKGLEEKSVVSPLYTYISSIIPSFKIDSSGKSTSYGGASAYNNKHTIYVNVELEKSSGSSWSTVKSWSISGPGGMLVGTENDYYVTWGTYRVCVTAKVYDAFGKLLETQSAYSPVITY